MTYTCNWGLTCVSIINATCQLMNILVLSGTTSVCHVLGLCWEPDSSPCVEPGVRSPASQMWWERRWSAQESVPSRGEGPRCLQ